MTETKRRRGRPRKNPLPRPEKKQDEQIQEEPKAVEEEPKEEPKSEPQPLPEVDDRANPIADPLKSDDPLPSIENFNPLSDSVEQREYSSPKIAQGVTDEIDEPQFHQPSYQELSGEQNAEESGAGQWNPITDGNPVMEDLPQGEKKAAVKTMVNAVLDAYDGLHLVAQRVVQYPEENIHRLHQEGEINKFQRIPVGPGGSDVNVLELTESFNQQASEALQPSEEFREKVTPPMTRVFEKKGWGMTDEQALLLYFGQDIAQKAIIVASLRSQMNQIIDAGRVNKPQSKQEEAGPISDEAVQMEEEMMDSSADSFDEDIVSSAGAVTQNGEAEELTNKMAMPEKSPLAEDTRREPKAPEVKTSYKKGHRK